MQLYELIDKIDVIKDNLNDLDRSVCKCDKNGKCLADNSDFKSLINYLSLFVDSYKQEIIMENKQSKLFNEVAEFILDSPDCKQEIIWLLKKYFKDENELSDTYNDLINRR
tara:strand:+ start:1496 stop:1828 length:333 start_codon:yes stop_codon:yes gene_type:complete